MKNASRKGTRDWLILRPRVINASLIRKLMVLRVGIRSAGGLETSEVEFRGIGLGPFLTWR